MISARPLRIACIALALSAPAAQALEPRTPLPREPLASPPGFEQRLVVKFSDALRVRAAADGSLRSAAGADLAALRSFAASNRLRFEPLLALPEATLRSMQERAAARSNRAQPDLAGMAIVHAPAGSSLAALGEAFQAMSQVEFACIEALGVPPPVDIAPATPDLVPNQSYRPPNPGMDVDYAWIAGATGAGVRLSDCEYGWTPAHEDLNEISLHLEPGQTINPGVFANGWDQHGTAVIGETSAMPNGYGCSGIVPDADVYTWPEWTVEGGYRRATCIASAIAASSAGDVVLLEMQTVGAGGDYGPAELDMAVWTVVKNGTDAGVIVVGAAGNGNQNLDSPAYAGYMGRGDSGAIIVGAGSSSTTHAKLGFSTYGSRVNVQGWGQNVFTLGYGAFAQYGGDPNQRYTQAFNGTSSASPFIASACVSLQSLALATTGIPLTPLELRQLLMDTGRPQGGVGGHIGPFPDLRAAILEYYASLAASVAQGSAAASGGSDLALAVAPNPFRDATEVRFALPSGERVSLEVFDVAGRRVRGLLRGEAPAGERRIAWDGRDETGSPVAPGLYLLRLGAGPLTAEGRVLRLR